MTGGRTKTPRGCAGNASIVLVLITPALFGVAGLVVDGGRAINARERAADLAEQAARAGADALDVSVVRAGARTVIDPRLARTRAEDYLAGAGSSGTVAVNDTSVTVTVRATTPSAFLAIIGISQIRVRSEATAHPELGVDAGEAP